MNLLTSRGLFGWFVGLMVAGLVGAAYLQAQEDDPFGPDPFGQNSPGGEYGGEFDFGSDDPFSGDQPTRPAARNDSRDEVSVDKPTSALTKPGTIKPDTVQPCIWSKPRSQSAQRIERVLRKPLTSVGLDFSETPLEEIVEFLRDEYEIEIQIDVQSLDELGLKIDLPVTTNLRKISLRSALRLMLKPMELTTIVSDEVILVTTEEEAQSQLFVAVYPVGDLLSENSGLEDVIDTLLSTVSSDSWSENGGGDAEIRPLAPGLLVISQTQAVHAELLNTLNAIRQASQLPEAGASIEARKLNERQRQERRRGGGGFGGGGGGFGGGGFGFGGGGQFSIPTGVE